MAVHALVIATATTNPNHHCCSHCLRFGNATTHGQHGNPPMLASRGTEAAELQWFFRFKLRRSLRCTPRQRKLSTNNKAEEEYP